LAIGTAVPIKMISCSRKSKKPLPGLLYLSGDFSFGH